MKKCCEVCVIDVFNFFLYEIILMLFWMKVKNIFLDF